MSNLTLPGRENFVLESNLDYVASLSLTLFYLVLLMVSGLVGNTLVFVVYYRRFKPSVTRTYILAMSVCDLTSNCLALPSDIYEIRFHYDFADDAGCKFFGFITRFLALQGAVILIAIAVDRWRKICRATRKPRRLQHVYVELACLIVFALSYAAPFGVLRGLQTIAVQSSNVTGTTCSIDDVYVGSLFFVIYNASMGLGFIISVSIMAVCYALIARHLWRHRKRLLHNARSRQSQSALHGRSQTEQNLKRRLGDQRTADPAKHSGGHLSAEQLEDEDGEDEKEVQGSGEKGQFSITEDSDLSSITPDTENDATCTLQTSGVLASSLTSISETEETGPQQVTQSFSGDLSSQDIVLSVETPASNSKMEHPAKKFRGAAILVNVNKSLAAMASGGDRGPKAPRKKTRPGLKSGAGKKKMPTRTTLMMFVLAALFVLSYLPYLSMAALYRGKDLVGDNFWTWNLHQMALRSFFINSAVNPLVYSFCSARFRQECRLLFRRRH